MTFDEFKKQALSIQKGSELIKYLKAYSDQFEIDEEIGMHINEVAKKWTRMEEGWLY